MENASKAIIIAGGILISLVIISLLVMLFGGIGDAYKAQDDSKAVEQLEKYNRQFAKYYNKSLYGAELLSLINLIDDYHERILSDVGGDENATVYLENKVTLSVKMYRTIEGYEETDEYGRKVKKYKGLNKGLHTLEDVKNWYNTGSDELQREFKSIPFECTTTTPNPKDPNRISKMCFEQILEPGDGT